MKNKAILITGGCGFIGSNFITYFIKKYKNYDIINLDLLTYAGDRDNIKELDSHPNYYFIKGNICNHDLLTETFKKFNIQGVIHFAAESHVDNSIYNPDIFVKTNVNGTFNLLETAYKYWMKSPNVYKEEFLDCRFHHISTDEVYGSLGEDGLFTEKTPYSPNSPYSASKAASDMFVRSYHETYGLNTVLTNCSNNYGPKQHTEKLIPKIIKNALSGKKIPIYGNGKNVRDWLYVTDHCKGIDLVYHEGESGGVYNIGGKNEKTNIEIVNLICSILDKKVPSKSSYKNLITFVEDRFGHDMRYAIDATKIESELGWQANETFESGIDKTIDWYIEQLK